MLVLSVVRDAECVIFEEVWWKMLKKIWQKVFIVENKVVILHRF
jgi:hypothetical protein